MDERQEHRKLRALFLLEEKDRALLKRFFGPNEASDLGQICSETNFDTERQEFLLYLSRLAQKDGFRRAPAQIVPRMKGLIRYHMVNNVVLMQGLFRVTDALQKEGIPVMLMKGGAAYAHYDRLQPRLMWDTDIAVPAGCAQKACRIIAGLGFSEKGSAPHSTDFVCGNHYVDLHRVILKKGGEENSRKIWDRARKITFQGRAFLVPSAEDYLICLLENEFRNHVVGEGVGRRMKWYYDTAVLISRPDFPGWEAVALRAKELGVPKIVRYMLGVFDEYFPGWIDSCLFAELLPEQEAFDSRTLLSLRSYAAENDRYWKDAEKGRMPHRISRWLELMKLEYRYMNSEVSPAQSPVGIVQMLLIHWQLDNVGQLPRKVVQRLRKMKKKGAAPSA